MSEYEIMIFGQEGRLSGGNGIKGVNIDSGEVQDVGDGEGIMIKKGEIIVELEMDYPAKIDSQGVFAGKTGVGCNIDGDIVDVAGISWDEASIRFD